MVAHGRRKEAKKMKLDVENALQAARTQTYA